MVLGDAGSPRFIHRELPIYPPIARKFGKVGKVVLKLTLDAHGKLQEIKVIEANGFGFAESASAATRKSTFAPAEKTAEPYHPGFSSRYDSSCMKTDETGGARSIASVSPGSLTIRDVLEHGAPCHGSHPPPHFHLAALLS
jgi:TonB family protein